MNIGGVSIILILGVINIALVLFQMSTGLRWIRISYSVHKKTGVILFFGAALHAFLAILSNYG
jgi:cytochrome b subunit of formate dehydrogenase